MGQVKPSSPAAGDRVRRRGGTQPAPLSLDDVITAGLTLVQQLGIERITIKALAAELGVTSPAVYHYVSGKEDLLDRICEQVTATVDLSVSPDVGWQEQVVAIMRGLHQSFGRYPGVGARALSMRGPAPASERISATLRRIALDAEFTPSDADELVVALHLLFSGWLVGKPPTSDPPTQMTADLLTSVTRRLLAGFDPSGVEGSPE